MQSHETLPEKGYAQAQELIALEHLAHENDSLREMQINEIGKLCQHVKFIKTVVDSYYEKNPVNEDVAVNTSRNNTPLQKGGSMLRKRDPKTLSPIKSEIVPYIDPQEHRKLK